MESNGRTVSRRGPGEQPGRAPREGPRGPVAPSDLRFRRVRTVAFIAALVAFASPPLAAATEDAPAPSSPPQPASSRDEDFEPELPAPSLAFGPVREGRPTPWAEVGWLRSGIGMALGLPGSVDLTLEATAFLLHGGFREQKDVFAGVRWSPASEGLFRAGISGEAGLILFGGDAAPGSTFSLRGQLTAGLALEGIATAYVRGEIRGLSFHSLDHVGWARDEELGCGIERPFRRFVAGAETFVWARPGLRGLPQWRLRVGWAP